MIKNEKEPTLAKKTVLIVSCGQYETCAIKVPVFHKTEKGLLRRARQLSNKNAVYGDNFASWIKAKIAIADDADEWGPNQIIGGRWCKPKNEWLKLWDK